MNGHEIALWSAVAAGASYLLALGIFDVLHPDQWVEYLGALIVAVITGVAIYAKQRLDDAKSAKPDNPPHDGR